MEKKTLNISISEIIDINDVICVFNREYNKIRICSHIPVIRWSIIDTIFNGVSCFARPPTVSGLLMSFFKATTYKAGGFYI